MSRSALVLICVLIALPAFAATTPTATTTQCGNKMLDAGETCASCPADCQVGPCHPATERARFAVRIVVPEQAAASAAVLRIGYRSDRLSLPGAGTDKSIRERISTPEHNVMAFNDFDYALRVVAGHAQSLPSGQVFTVEFDRCDGAPAPSAADANCAIEACAGSTGPVEGCTCSVSPVER